jgi:hypothetical protein
MGFTAVLGLLSTPLRADNPPVTQVLDKAIKAMGGEERLGRLHAFSAKAKGKVILEGGSNPISSETTVEGLDHFRSQFEGEFNGNKVEGVTVLNGDKGWRKFGDQNMEMEPDAVKNEKRTIYLMVVPASILPLKSKDFKVESAADETVRGKPAAALKVTGPDGKDFTLYFDKESGLPVRMIAKVVGWMGDEYTQDVSYGDFKDFDGVKRASKVTIKRDGEDFVEQEITDFKPLEKVPAEKFSEPK